MLKAKIYNKLETLVLEKEIVHFNEFLLDGKFSLTLFYEINSWGDSALQDFVEISKEKSISKIEIFEDEDLIAEYTTYDSLMEVATEYTPLSTQHLANIRFVKIGQLEQEAMANE